MTTKRKCKKCGKEFRAVLEWAYYCSAQCERLAHNPVAKFLKSSGGVAKTHKPRKGKGSYRRKDKFNVKLY